jgi:anthranilate phosphoribosyltransferase
MKTVLNSILSGKELSRAETSQAVNLLLDGLQNGSVTTEQVSAFLVGLRMKQETAQELLGFIDALNARAVTISTNSFPEVLDVCGTGGDQSGTFNVSTAVALVLASADVVVAKHGNRGVSSASGSSDVLEKLGLGSDLTPASVIGSLEKFKLSFLFAPAFHPVLTQVSQVRKNLGVYTIFNALGPLLNPVPLTHQMMGVYDPSLLLKVAEVLRERNLKEAFVVHGADGLDELTLSGPSSIAHLKQNEIEVLTVTPEDFGLAPAELLEVRGGDPAHNARLIEGIFSGEKSPKRDLVVMNAAAALVLLGRERNFSDAARFMEQVIDDQKPASLLERMKKKVRVEA